jgi:hypothetical protein
MTGHPVRLWLGLHRMELQTFSQQQFHTVERLGRRLDGLNYCRWVWLWLQVKSLKRRHQVPNRNLIMRAWIHTHITSCMPGRSDFVDRLICYCREGKKYLTSEMGRPVIWSHPSFRRRRIARDQCAHARGQRVILDDVEQAASAVLAALAVRGRAT